MKNTTFREIFGLEGLFTKNPTAKYSQLEIPFALSGEDSTVLVLYARIFASSYRGGFNPVDAFKTVEGALDAPVRFEDRKNDLSLRIAEQPTPTIIIPTSISSSIISENQLFVPREYFLPTRIIMASMLTIDMPDQSKFTDQYTALANYYLSTIRNAKPIKHCGPAGLDKQRNSDKYALLATL